MKNRNMRFLYAMAMAATIATSTFSGTVGTVTAFAAETQAQTDTVYPTPKGTANLGKGNASITIHGNEGQSLVGKKFNVYKIFDAENSKGGESINYTLNSAYADAVKTVVGKKLNKVGASVTEYEVIDYIQSLNKNQVEGAQANQKLEGSYSAYRYFVEDLRNELVKSKVAADMVKVSATTADNSCVIGGLAYGYYVVDEVSEVEGTHSAASMCIVNTANPEAGVNIKSDYPSVIKKIQEDDNKNKVGNSGWNDVADYEIGQTIPYKYESNMPNANGYDTYYYAWHDKMDSALTFNKDSVSIKIYADSSESSKSYTLKANEFVVNTNPGNGETFTVAVNDIKKIIDREFDNVDALKENTYGQKIVLTYNATLNDNAAADTGRPGFENDVRLEFSNDADHDHDGSTGFTPWDTVVCFTYKLDVLKTNNHDLKLEGAKFRLYSDAECQNEVYVKKASNGYNVINRDSLGGTDHTGGTAPSNAVEMVSDANGNFVIYGLDGGTYYLKETEAPTGYRKLLDPIVLNVKPTFTDDRNNYVKGDGATDKTLKKLDVSAHVKEFLNGSYKEADTDLTTDVDAGSANLTVINTVGKKLPVTGSSVMVIMLAAGTALAGFSVAKYRKDKKDEEKKQGE